MPEIVLTVLLQKGWSPEARASAAAARKAKSKSTAPVLDPNAISTPVMHPKSSEWTEQRESELFGVMLESGGGDFESNSKAFFDYAATKPNPYPNTPDPGEPVHVSHVDPEIRQGFKDQVGKAFDEIPEAHKKWLNGATIDLKDNFKVDGKMPEGRGNTVGLFAPANNKVSVVQNLSYMGNDREHTYEVEEPGAVLTHEIGHALDYATKGWMAMKVKTQLEKDVKGLKREHNYNRHFTSNPNETFAELYALTYAPKEVTKAFGIRRGKAQEIFQKSSDILKGLKL